MRSVELLDVASIELHREPPTTAVVALNLTDFAGAEYVVDNASTRVQVAFTAKAQYHVNNRPGVPMLQANLGLGSFYRGLLINSTDFHLNDLAERDCRYEKLHMSPFYVEAMPVSWSATRP